MRQFSIKWSSPFTVQFVLLLRVCLLSLYPKVNRHVSPVHSWYPTPVVPVCEFNQSGYCSKQLSLICVHKHKYRAQTQLSVFAHLIVHYCSVFVCAVVVNKDNVESCTFPDGPSHSGVSVRAHGADIDKVSGCTGERTAVASVFGCLKHYAGLLHTGKAVGKYYCA